MDLDEEKILKKEKPLWIVVQNDFKLDDMKKDLVYALKNQEYSSYVLMKPIDNTKFLLSDVWVKNNQLVYKEDELSSDNQINYFIIEEFHSDRYNVEDLYFKLLDYNEIYGTIPYTYQKDMANFMTFNSELCIDEINSEDISQLFELKEFDLKI